MVNFLTWKDRTDVIAAITGAGATLGTATLVKNRALLRRQPLLPPNAPVFRPSFQYPLFIYYFYTIFIVVT